MGGPAAANVQSLQVPQRKIRARRDGRNPYSSLASQSREFGKYSIFAAISERFFGAKIAPQNGTLFGVILSGAKDLSVSVWDRTKFAAPGKLVRDTGYCFRFFPGEVY
jgi:hypothetical protein